MSLSLVCTHRASFSYCCPSDGFRIDQTQRRRTAEMSQGHTRGRRRIDSPCGGQTKKVSGRLGFLKFISGIELGESSGSSKKPQQQQRFGKNLLQCRAQKTYTVEIEHEGENHRLEVAEDETILSVALEAGLDVPYDCQLGVCMTCPAKLEKGEVNQKEGMLSEDVIEKGYALMCVSYPLSDCKIRSIPEDELLSLQLVTAND
ncbi:unnamed protein product [Sphagnum jensenii]|uniref:Ferredoxin n=1 Tax=Sphagnum jensenii TaxID=128206 RepID=A0ABP0WDL4_9BRYO